MRNIKFLAGLAALLVFGTPSQATAQVLGGVTAGDQFGFAIAPAGDVNDDGRDDFLVGAPLGKSGGSVGVATLYLGPAQNYPATPARTFAGELANDRFGHALAEAGDVNNDGYADFLIGAPHATTSAPGGAQSGKVYLYLGGSPLPSAPARVFFGDLPQAHFGAALAGGFDFNNDGFDDFAVGAPDHNSGGTARGQVTIYFGAATAGAISVGHVIYGDQANWMLGYSLADAGDVNNDGFGDLVAGAPQLNDFNSGRAVVWLGKSTTLTPPSRVLLSGETGTDAFGFSVSGAGDLNADGYDDVLVGAPEHDSAGSDKGALYLFRGGAFMNAGADWKAVGSVGGELLGWSVHGGQDHNGDGVPDLLAGAPGANTLGADSGEARLYFGKATPNLTADRVLVPVSPAPSFEAGDRFGACVRFLGSWNGDAYAEIGVGAPDGNISSGSVAGYANLIAYEGTITPVLLLGFTATGTPNGVRIAWILRDAHELSGLRVEALEGGAAREVHTGWLPFDADHVDDPAFNPRVTGYRLYGRDRAGGVRVMGDTGAPGQAGALRVGLPSANPFQDRVRLPASGLASTASASVWDVSGRLVRTLPVPAGGGTAELEWDGRTEAGMPAPAGLYFIRVASGGTQATVKVLRLF